MAKSARSKPAKKPSRKNALPVGKAVTGGRKGNGKGSPSDARLAPAVDKWEPSKKLRVESVEIPARLTLGDLGTATRVSGADKFAPTVLMQPFAPKALVGIDARTVRTFRLDEETGRLTPVWNSGINERGGFVWTKIRRPGTYLPIGLPRDLVLRCVLRFMADQRQYADPGSEEDARAITRAGFALFLEAEDRDLDELRRILTTVETQNAIQLMPQRDLRMGEGGHLLPIPLPRERSVKDMKAVLGKMRIPATGLPEEALFFRPELFQDEPWTIPAALMGNRGLPVPLMGGGGGFGGFGGGGLPGGDLPGEGGGLPGGGMPDEGLPWPGKWHPGGWEPGDDICPPWPVRWPFPWLPFPIRWPIPIRPFPWPRPMLCRLFSRNWWMYHHDERHSGAASGCSDIRSTSVGTMTLRASVGVDGPVFSIPTVVNGKIYVGTANRTGGGGTLYKIDLATGGIDASRTVTGAAFYWVNGVGGSPAVVGNRVYFTAVHGKVYCADATTLALLWTVDLKNADFAHRQPVNNAQADCWSSPLVVDGRVYVGCGEGESGSAFSFVYCLDAATGRVIWLYCTTKFVSPSSAGSENQPNVIPTSAAASWAVAQGFTLHADPPNRGAPVWSSCAYDRGLNRIYVGTGNSRDEPGSADTPLPDPRYSSGLLSLDATTGQFRGFHQPAVASSYKPGDMDVDVPSAPTVFTAGTRRLVGYGSKNGSYFLLDADTLAQVRQRQLLPKDAVTGATLPLVDTHGGVGENYYGVFGTGAVHAGLERLFVAVGGYSGAIDQTTTPFVRAMDWDTLDDAWPTAVQTVGANQVRRYTVGRPPLYDQREPGLSSPAVVNDVVFVSTSRPSLYAFDADSGAALWTAPSMPPPAGDTYTLGPAVYGNYVVVGTGSQINIYSL